MNLFEEGEGKKRKETFKASERGRGRGHARVNPGGARI